MWDTHVVESTACDHPWFVIVGVRREMTPVDLPPGGIPPDRLHQGTRVLGGHGGIGDLLENRET